MTRDPADDELLLPHESPRQADVRHRIGRLLAAAPFPPEKVIDNLPLFMRLQPLADLLSIDALYRMALDVPGAIMEFGVHRGRHVALFTAPRGVHEPHNPLRRIVGFDTFDGFPDIAAVDELGHAAALGKFALPDGYTSYLRNVLSAHEANEPLNHIRRTTAHRRRRTRDATGVPSGQPTDDHCARLLRSRPIRADLRGSASHPPVSGRGQRRCLR